LAGKLAVVAGVIFEKGGLGTLCNAGQVQEYVVVGAAVAGVVVV
jgi:hypothetical protein